MTTSTTKIDLSSIAAQISVIFRGADVKDVVVDDEFGGVTATVRGMKYVECGFIEDYA